VSETDETISLLESLLPVLSGIAFVKAREQMLAAGQDVLQSEQGVIYRVTPSGESTAVKRIDPPSVVQKGSKVQLR
jgi:hypothetical protein